jgi:large subunit ribosomal protein L25
METIKLTVREREATGDGPARRLRAEGWIPGVTYGKGLAGTAISVNLEDFKAVRTHGHNVVLELEFEGAAKPAKGAKGAAKGKPAARYAVVKAIQFHPTRRNVLHVVGIPVGVTEGGVLDWEHREVVVRALPGDIPSVLQLDVSDLRVGHHVAIGALSAPSGVTILDDPETMVAAVQAPRAAVEEPEAEPGAAPAEPEVIGGAKSEE